MERDKKKQDFLTDDENKIKEELRRAIEEDLERNLRGAIENDLALRLQDYKDKSIEAICGLGIPLMNTFVEVIAKKMYFSFNENPNEKEDIFPQLLEILEKSDLRDTLEAIVRSQAYFLWIVRDRKTDNNINRELNDYYDAKRFISFLIVSEFLNRCRKYGNHSSDCKAENFRDLSKDVIQYFISLSVEEFVRISAYLDWRNSKNIYGTGDPDEKKFYHNALKRIDFSRFNCMQKNAEKNFEEICDDVKEYFFDIVSTKKAEYIMNSKRNAIKRFRQTQHVDSILLVEDYVKDFYSEITNAFNKKGSMRNAIKILNRLYMNNDVPNMLEYYLKCQISSNVKRSEHEKVMQNQKKNISFKFY